MITDKHRCFFVNGVIRFAFFFDPAIIDPDKIVNEFLICRDFISLSSYCGWKVKDTKISEDLMRVDIRVSVPMEKPEPEPEE